MGVNKLTWENVGRVTGPGRYMYRFGWLTITAEDLDVWKSFPNAKFTLVNQPSTEASLTESEFRRGCFDISSDG